VTTSGLSIESNGLTAIENARSVLVGRDRDAPAPPDGVGVGAAAGLERALLPALSRPPCLVAFSGGRDSSGLLAIATRTARREGLPDPVPISARYPAAPAAHEDDWQELVVRHLDLADWERREFADEVDLVGPISRALLERYGLQYPYNLHLLKPMIDAAPGGSFVTGLGGDEALTPGSRALAVLTRRVWPRPRDLLTVGLALMPRFVRRAVLARRPTLSFPWLSDEANAALGADWLDDQVRFPLRWDARLREWSRARYVRMTVRNVARIALERDVQVIHPFADPVFVAALAADGGARGFPSRVAAMDALFGDVLPTSVRQRGSKASFDAVLWSGPARSFAQDLSDAYLDTALQRLGLELVVDRTALARHWGEPSPLANSFLLLQACWLALNGRAASEPGPAGLASSTSPS
jgi:hypothetical protein